MKEAAEKAKIELSTMMQTEINLPYLTADASGPKHLVMTMTRSKLEQLTADLVDRTLAPLKQALADAGLKAVGYQRSRDGGRHDPYAGRAGSRARISLARNRTRVSIRMKWWRSARPSRRVCWAAK